MRQHAIHLCLLIAIALFSFTGQTLASQAHSIRQQVIALFESRDFVALENLLESYQEDFERDPSNEPLLSIAFKAFKRGDPHWQGHFEAWRAHSPQSYIQAGAEGFYFHSLANLARGERLSRETHPEQFARMKKLAKLAKARFEEAVAEHPKFALGYARLVFLSILLKERDRANIYVRQSLGVAPPTTELIAALSWALQPWWGGNQESYEWLAENADLLAEQWPHLKDYRGYGYFVQARLRKRKGLYEEAQPFIDLALSQASNPAYLRLKSHLAWHKKNFEEALGLARLIIQDIGADERDFEYLGRTLERLRDYDGALSAYEEALKIRPYHPRILWRRAKLLRYSRRYEEAKADFDKAMIYGDKDSRFVLSRTRLYYQIFKDYAEAEIGYRAMTELEPDVPKHHYSLAIMQHKQLDCAVMVSLRDYLFMCITSSDCNDEKVKWARSFMKYAWSKGQCSLSGEKLKDF